MGAIDRPASFIAATISIACASPLATAALNSSSLDSGRRCWLSVTKFFASSAALA
jgi:hypothetical protein